MNRFKRTMTAVGTAVVLMATGAALATPATAAPATAAPFGTAGDTGTKGLESAVPAATVHKTKDGRFIVSTSWQRYDGPDPTPVRVEVRRAGTDKVVAVIDRFTENFDDGGTSEGGDDWKWYEADDQPLVLDEMGDYELDVYAEDRNGKELSRRNAGRCTYALDARFQASSSRTEFSLDHLDTKVTGTVTAVHPRTGARLPLPGGKVRATLGEGAADAVSDAQGRFTVSVAALGTEEGLALTVRLTSGDTARSAKIPVTIKAQQAVLTLSTPGPFTVRYGTAVPLRGTVGRRAADGTVKAVAGVQVTAQDDGGGGPSALAVTGADGRFTLSPTIVRTGSWEVNAEEVWLTGGGTRTATVAKVTHTTKVVEEKLVSTTKYGKLTISGKVVVDGVTSQQAPVQIQYRSSSRHWVTAGSIVVPYGKTFTTTVSAPHGEPASTWRVYTPGTTTIGPSTGTRVIRQPRTATTLGADFGRRTVAKGEQLSLSGVLKTYDPVKGEAAYGGQTVRFYFQPTGSAVWQEMGSAVSRADGSVSRKFTAQTSGVWRLRFIDADAAHLAATSGVSLIKVTG
ncbi:hypothetical protein ACFYYB_39375 [Streptomyces sp. NPDC002886]|uniref:hypothetical protein n=1 Tax=Streptomyces sp. NPDC002886 TaxID=3364667 RepID=UPI00368F8419